ncbi:MAG TPA: hypothetical protein VFG66_07630 [Gemmatimonadales bacterium]|nr:hypothetical protein [Gemmatimonadales bacterium]
MKRGRPRASRITPLREEGRLPSYRRRSRWRRVETHLTRHLELYLSAASLAVILMLPLALELGTDVQELAGAAIAACMVQGFVHWLLRRRAEAVRRELIAEVRGLLRDRINNHLQVVLFSLARGPGARADAADRARLATAIEAVAAVSRTLAELSTDSLRRWKEYYGDSLSAAASAAGNGADSGTDGPAGEK